jgi:DNA-binding winged helix-turn-helix (wHTH) protein/tetratricopeptide (TPR) repeat protein
VNAPANFPVCIAGLTIDPDRRHVSGVGGDEAVEPLVMQLLLRLTGRVGEVVQRRELFSDLWGNAQVGDASLNRLVAELRKVLERTSNGAVIIETVPRTGYRLIAERTDDEEKPAITRRSVLAGSAAALAVGVGGAGLWISRENKAQRATRLVDRGDTLLRDAAPMLAGEALPPLQQALEMDPSNVRALGLSALANETQAFNGGPNAAEALRDADQQAREALRLDPSEPHARLALLDMRAGSLSWAQTEAGLQALRRDAPTNFHIVSALSSLFQAAGILSQAWFYNEQAAAIAPSSPTPYWRRALRLWTGGRTDDALRLTERLMPLWPRHAMVWNARFMILAFSGRTGAAAAMMNDNTGPLGNTHPVKPAQWGPTLQAFTRPTAASVAAATDANLAAARSNPGQAAYAAMALAHLGKVDEAYDVINGLLLSKGPLVANRPVEPRSFNANAPGWCRTQWLFMPPLATVRGDKRFGPLSEELGLAQFWKQRGAGPDTVIVA